MAEQRRALAAMADAELAGALRDLAAAVAFPSASAGPTDIAAIVRQRLVARAAGPPSVRHPRLDRSPAGPAERPRRGRRDPRPRRDRRRRRAGPARHPDRLRRADATGRDGRRPRPRPRLAGPPGRPHLPPAMPVGSTLGLGTAVSLDDAARIGGLDLVLRPTRRSARRTPSTPLANRVALVWPSGPACRPTRTTASGCCSASSAATSTTATTRRSSASSAQVTPGDGAATPATGSAARRTSSSTSTRAARPSTTATGSSATRSSGRTAT